MRVLALLMVLGLAFGQKGGGGSYDAKSFLDDSTDLRTLQENHPDLRKGCGLPNCQEDYEWYSKCPACKLCPCATADVEMKTMVICRRKSDNAQVPASLCSPLEVTPPNYWADDRNSVYQICTCSPDPEYFDTRWQVEPVQCPSDCGLSKSSVVQLVYCSADGLMLPDAACQPPFLEFGQPEEKPSVVVECQATADCTSDGVYDWYPFGECPACPTDCGLYQEAVSSHLCGYESKEDTLSKVIIVEDEKCAKLGPKPMNCVCEATEACDVGEHVCNDEHLVVDVGVPGALGNVISGWDISKVVYDWEGNDLTLTMHCFDKICGDADGDGNPGGTSQALSDQGGQDLPGLQNTESLGFIIGYESHRDADLFVGVPIGAGTGDTIFAYIEDKVEDLGFWVPQKHHFSEPIPGAKIIGGNTPDANNKQYTVTIKDFASYRDPNKPVEKLFFVGYAGSQSDAGIGEDKIVCTAQTEKCLWEWRFPEPRCPDRCGLPPLTRQGMGFCKIGGKFVGRNDSFVITKECPATACCGSWTKPCPTVDTCGFEGGTLKSSVMCSYLGNYQNETLCAGNSKPDDECTLDSTGSCDCSCKKSTADLPPYPKCLCKDKPYKIERPGAPHTCPYVDPEKDFIMCPACGDSGPSGEWKVDPEKGGKNVCGSLCGMPRRQICNVFQCVVDGKPTEDMEQCKNPQPENDLFVTCFETPDCQKSDTKVTVTEKTTLTEGGLKESTDPNFPHHFYSNCISECSGFNCPQWPNCPSGNIPFIGRRRGWRGPIQFRDSLDDVGIPAVYNIPQTGYNMEYVDVELSQEGTLSVEIKCIGDTICGDADGNGDPSIATTTGQALRDDLGLDMVHFRGTESVTISIDVDNDLMFDYIIGIPAYDDDQIVPKCEFKEHKERENPLWHGMPMEPQQAFDENDVDLKYSCDYILGATTGGNYGEIKKRLKFEIHDFKTKMKSSIVRMHFYLGSQQDAGIGEDHMMIIFRQPTCEWSVSKPDCPGGCGKQAQDICVDRTCLDAETGEVMADECCVESDASQIPANTMTCPATKGCDGESCEWEVGEWGDCPCLDLCSDKENERPVTCKCKQTGFHDKVISDDSKCSSPKPGESYKCASAESCSYKWEVEQLPCPVAPACGFGDFDLELPMWCVDSKGLKVSHEMCDGEPPPSTKPCKDVPCCDGSVPTWEKELSWKDFEKSFKETYPGIPAGQLARQKALADWVVGGDDIKTVQQNWASYDWEDSGINRAFFKKFQSHLLNFQG